MVKYYYSGANRVAMRVGANPVVFLMGDHLGSTSVAVNEQGALVGGPQLYKAWGETRAGSLPTRYQYTGQFNQIELGIYYYNARWYDPYISRWTQPDSIVPLASQGTQAYDRYAYVNNNPSRYIDPSGHGGSIADPKEKGGEFRYWNFHDWSFEQYIRSQVIQAYSAFEYSYSLWLNAQIRAGINVKTPDAFVFHGGIEFGIAGVYGIHGFDIVWNRNQIGWFWTESSGPWTKSPNTAEFTLNNRKIYDLVWLFSQFDVDVEIGPLYSPLLWDIQAYNGYSINRAGGLSIFAGDWFTSLNDLTANPEANSYNGYMFGLSWPWPIGGGYYVSHSVYDQEWTNVIKPLLPMFSGIFNLF
jgi:RHS repeat-associated protein